MAALRRAHRRAVPGLARNDFRWKGRDYVPRSPHLESPVYLCRQRTVLQLAVSIVWTGPMLFGSDTIDKADLGRRRAERVRCPVRAETISLLVSTLLHARLYYRIHDRTIILQLVHDIFHLSLVHYSCIYTIYSTAVRSTSYSYNTLPVCKPRCPERRPLAPAPPCTEHVPASCTFAAPGMKSGGEVWVR